MAAERKLVTLWTRCVTCSRLEPSWGRSEPRSEISFQVGPVGSFGESNLDGRHGSGHVKTSQLALLHPSVLWQKLRIPLSGRGAVDGAGATESHVKRTQLLAIMQPKHKNETYCSRSYQKKICCFFFVEFSRSFSLSWTCFLISTTPSRKHGLVASHQFLLLREIKWQLRGRPWKAGKRSYELSFSAWSFFSNF